MGRAPGSGGMLAAVAAGGHPAVAGLLGIGTAGLAGAVVAMAWSVHARQIRLAEQLARRQLVVTADAGPAHPATNGSVGETNGAAARGAAAKLVIDGPDTVVAGEQARFRVPAAANRKVVSWAAGGGSLAQGPDPSHPDELLLIADRPGELMVTVWVREGMTERRATKPVTAVPDLSPAPPLTLRMFLNGWGLVVVAVLVIGFAAALDALGSLGSGDFIAVAVPLAALLGVTAVARGAGDANGRCAPGKDGPLSGPR